MESNFIGRASKALNVVLLVFVQCFWLSYSPQVSAVMVHKCSQPGSINGPGGLDKHPAICWWARSQMELGNLQAQIPAALSNAGAKNEQTNDLK